MARESETKSRLISGYPRLGLRASQTKRNDLKKINYWNSNKQYNSGNVEK